jgi:hypothetical protein
MFLFDFRLNFIMPRAGLRNSLVEPPRPVEGKRTIELLKDEFRILETSPIVKNRKRTRKVLHPIATDTGIESSPAPSTDSACASPARRARLLNPRTSFVYSS